MAKSQVAAKKKESIKKTTTQAKKKKTSARTSDPAQIQFPKPEGERATLDRQRTGNKQHQAKAQSVRREVTITIKWGVHKLEISGVPFSMALSGVHAAFMNHMIKQGLQARLYKEEHFTYTYTYTSSEGDEGVETFTPKEDWNTSVFKCGIVDGSEIVLSYDDDKEQERLKQSNKLDSKKSDNPKKTTKEQIKPATKQSGKPAKKAKKGRSSKGERKSERKRSLVDAFKPDDTKPPKKLTRKERDKAAEAEALEDVADELFEGEEIVEYAVTEAGDPEVQAIMCLYCDDSDHLMFDRMNSTLVTCSRKSGRSIASIFFPDTPSWKDTTEEWDKSPNNVPKFPGLEKGLGAGLQQYFLHEAKIYVKNKRKSGVFGGKDKHPKYVKFLRWLRLTRSVSFRLHLLYPDSTDEELYKMFVDMFSKKRFNKEAAVSREAEAMFKRNHRLLFPKYYLKEEEEEESKKEEEDDKSNKEEEDNDDNNPILSDDDEMDNLSKDDDNDQDGSKGVANMFKRPLDGPPKYDSNTREFSDPSYEWRTESISLMTSLVNLVDVLQNDSELGRFRKNELSVNEKELGASTNFSTNRLAYMRAILQQGSETETLHPLLYEPQHDLDLRDAHFALAVYFAMNKRTVALNDTVALRALRSLRASNLLAPKAIVDAGQDKILELISPHLEEAGEDPEESASRICVLAKGVCDLGGHMPSTFNELSALMEPFENVRIAGPSLAYALMQDCFGCSTGIVADPLVTLMLVCLGLVEFESWWFPNDKGTDLIDINFRKVSPRFVAESVSTWLPLRMDIVMNKLQSLAVILFFDDHEEQKRDIVFRVIAEWFAPKQANPLTARLKNCLEAKRHFDKMKSRKDDDGGQGNKENDDSSDSNNDSSNGMGGLGDENDHDWDEQEDKNDSKQEEDDIKQEEEKGQAGGTTSTSIAAAVAKLRKTAAEAKKRDLERVGTFLNRSILGSWGLYLKPEHKENKPLVAFLGGSAKATQETHLMLVGTIKDTPSKDSNCFNIEWQEPFPKGVSQDMLIDSVSNSKTGKQALRDSIRRVEFLLP